MIVGVVMEARPGETRVAATPTTVASLRELGYDVVVDHGAGEAASFHDQAYTEAGAVLGDALVADIVVGVNAPTLAQRNSLRPGTTLIAMLNPRFDDTIVADLSRRPITALSMDAVPRISRAQSLDVLSSMANVAGYRAVVEAANQFGRMFTGQVTAAGKTPPARVFVVGAGVAGLAAIGAATAMGAIVRAFDVRPEVAEQVESMGAQFVELDDSVFESAASSDGYAKEMTAEQERVTAAMYDEEARAADIVITTALIPGRPAPKLITAATIAGMRPGSVVVDMAAANGGNVALTEPAQRVVTDHGVTILGYTDLATRLAAQSSQLYGTNIVNLMKLLTPEKDGQLTLDMEDVVQRGITVTRDGESMWPPPPVQVSAGPTIAAAPATSRPAPERAPLSAAAMTGLVLSAIAVFALVIASAPDPIPQHFTVLMLSIVIGYYVIGKVAHALHTPLMSITNAVSGVVVVGALVQIASEDTVVRVLSAAAILLASINIFGGFAVTRRMLAMFSREA